MIDRLIAGAGAVSAALDRFVRTVMPGRALADQPASLIVAGALAVIAALLVAVGVESMGTASLRALDPAVVATADDLGGRIHATVSGRLPSTYVETFDDADADGVQDPTELGAAWDYVLLGQGVDRGLIVRSERPPWDIYTYATSGVVVEDPDYVSADLDYLGPEASVTDLRLDPAKYIDATGAAGGAPHDLAQDLPAAGTAVSLTGARLIEYLTICSTDPDGDGVCSDAEVDTYEVFLYDHESGRAVVVVTDESPAYQPATFTGILRRDAASIASSVAAPGVSLAASGISVSPVYLLDEGATPADPTFVLLFAALAIMGAAVIGVGVLGGYVIFRRGGTMPAAAATFAPGERLATRVTGILRGPLGMVHVREARAAVIRWVAPPEATGPADDPADGTGTVAAAVSGEPAAPSTTTIVERTGRPEGIALGRGELTKVTVGTVTTFHGPRPGLRLAAGTGRLLLSFDDAEARDRVAAELAAGLGDRSPADPSTEDT